MVAGGSIPAILVGVVHVSAVVSHVVVNRTLLTSLVFAYPVTLTVVQYAGIALALSFWAIFGLVRVRTLPLLDSAKLAAGAACCSVLSNLSLRYNSLAAFQAARLTAAPAILFAEYMLGATCGRSRRNLINNGFNNRAFRNRMIGGSVIVALSAIGVMLSDANRSKLGYIYAFGAVVATALYQVLSTRLRLTTKANELQLQLVTKTLGFLYLIILAPFCDDYSADSDNSIQYYDIDDSVGVVLLLSAFLAFLSFVAQRASVARYTRRTYNLLAYTVSSAIFVAHFAGIGINVDDSVIANDNGSVSRTAINIGMQMPFVMILIFGTVLLARTSHRSISNQSHALLPSAPIQILNSTGITTSRPRGYQQEQRSSRAMSASRTPPNLLPAPALRALTRIVRTPNSEITHVPTRNITASSSTTGSSATTRHRSSHSDGDPTTAQKRAQID